jgi:hypothetical protein
MVLWFAFCNSQYNLCRRGCRLTVHDPWYPRQQTYTDRGIQYWYWTIESYFLFGFQESHPECHVTVMCLYHIGKEGYLLAHSCFGSYLLTIICENDRANSMVNKLFWLGTLFVADNVKNLLLFSTKSCLNRKISESHLEYYGLWINTPIVKFCRKRFLLPGANFLHSSIVDIGFCNCMLTRAKQERNKPVARGEEVICISCKLLIYINYIFMQNFIILTPNSVFFSIQKPPFVFVH